MNKHPFVTGKSSNIQNLILMSEEEKHLNVIYYNLSKYKINRLDLLLKYDNNLQFIESKEKFVKLDGKLIQISEELIKKVNNPVKTADYVNARNLLKKQQEHNIKIQAQLAHNEKVQKIVDHNEKVQKIVDHKSSIELFSKQCEHYINNIFINISNTDKIEYRYNFFMTL
jgi:hypothetical protein